MLRRDKLVRQALKERFIATLRNGETFHGLLVDADEKTFRFANASLVTGNHLSPVDGELFLPRAEVLYLQRPGGDG